MQMVHLHGMIKVIMIPRLILLHLNDTITNLLSLIFLFLKVVRHKI